MPGAAAGIATLTIVWSFVAPRAREPSRSDAGHRLQRLLRGPDDRRQDHQGEREAAREEAEAEMQDGHEEEEAEEAEDDRGNAGKGLGAEAQDPDEGPLLARTRRGRPPRPRRSGRR